MSSKDLSLSDKIKLLKELIKDVQDQDEKLRSDLYLYHWLRGNKLDIKKTDKAIRENLKWRANNGINELVDQDLDPELEARLPYFIGITGKGGIPVSYFKTGDMEAADIIEDHGKDRLVQFIAQVLAKKEKIVYEFDKTWTGSVDDLPPERAVGLYGIYDAENYSIKDNTSLKALQFFGEWAKMIVNYFPASGHVARVVNASKLLEIPMSIVRPIVSNRMDFTVHGKNEDDWAVVASALDREELEKLQERAKALKAKRLA